MSRTIRHSRNKISNLVLQQLESRVLMDSSPVAPPTFDRNPANPPLMRSSIYTSPFRRIRTGERGSVVPDNRGVLNPPVLPGLTKTVNLTFGGATTHTALPLGINIDQLS